MAIFLCAWHRIHVSNVRKYHASEILDYSSLSLCYFSCLPIYVYIMHRDCRAIFILQG